MAKRTSQYYAALWPGAGSYDLTCICLHDRYEGHAREARQVGKEQYFTLLMRAMVPRTVPVETHMSDLSGLEEIVCIWLQASRARASVLPG